MSRTYQTIKHMIKTTTKPTTGQLFLQAIADDMTRTATRPSVWQLGDEVHEMYTRIFWPAYLGVRPFALYEQLRNHVTAVACGYIERPTVQALADIFGGRGAVQGREAAAGRKPQSGMLQQLCGEMLLRLRTSGRGRQRTYQFGVLLHLPTLTPSQAAKLPRRWSEQHERFLGSLRGFDLPHWRDLTAASLVPDMVSATGWTWLTPSSGTVQLTAVSGPLAQMALTRDAYQCRFCDRPAIRVDFLIPPGNGGVSELGNVVAVCDDCLLRKNGRTPEQAGLLLLPPG